MLSAAASCALVLLALSALVVNGRTHDLDRAVLQAVQAVSNGAFDLIANLHTVLGLPYVTIPAAGAWSFALSRRGYGATSIAPLLIVVAVAVELALKLTTGHAPPGPEMSRSFISLVPAPETPSSFPSGHATRLTFLASLAAVLVARRAVTIAAVAFVAFTLVARVYIGDHWPTDVIGGLALGLAFALLAAGRVRSADPSRSRAVRGGRR